MTLVRCILGRFLGVVYHCFPPAFRRSHIRHKVPPRPQRRVWAGTRAQSGDRYDSGTLHPGQVFRGSFLLLSPGFRRTHFRHQVPPTSATTREILAANRNIDPLVIIASFSIFRSCFWYRQFVAKEKRIPIVYMRNITLFLFNDRSFTSLNFPFPYISLFIIVLCFVTRAFSERYHISYFVHTQTDQSELWNVFVNISIRTDFGRLVEGREWEGRSEIN